MPRLERSDLVYIARQYQLEHAEKIFRTGAPATLRCRSLATGLRK